MKYVYMIVVLGLVAVIGFQLFRLNSQRLEVVEKVEGINSKLDVLKNENMELIADFEYFSNFDNLAKEFKELFNYKTPSEKLIIIVPQKRE